MRALAFRAFSLSLLSIGLVASFAACGSSSGDDPPGDVPGDAGEAGAESVAVTPADARIGVLRPQTFTAAHDVTWSVEEGDAGGRIDDKGKYVSPPNPGVYHVVATSKVDPSVQAKATVTVVPLAASVLVGKVGGPGSIDGSISRARFANATSVSFTSASGGVAVVADATFHTIRKIAGGIITTIAGSPGQAGTTNGVGADARFDTPTSVAVNDDGKRMWVLDQKNNCIRTIDLGSGAVTTLAGTCGAAGHQDSTDGTGATALLDTSTYGGRMILGASKDALYLCELSTGSFRGIRRIDAVTGKTTSPVSGLNNSCAMAANYFTHEVYFNDNNNAHEIRKFEDPAGGPPNAPPLTSVCPSMPVNAFGSIAIDSGYGDSNDLYATSGSGTEIFHCDLATNTWAPAAIAGANGESRVVDGTGTQARFGRATISAYAPNQELFIGDGAVVRKMNLDTLKVETIAGLAATSAPVDGAVAAARLTSPIALALDERGRVVIADYTSGYGPNSTLRVFDPASASLTHVAGKPSVLSSYDTPLDGAKDDATFGIPTAQVVLGDDVFVLDIYGQAVRKVSLTTGAVATLAGELRVPGKSDGIGPAAHFTFFDPAKANVLGAGIATDGKDLYVADAGNFAVRKIVAATGEVTTLAGGTKGSENGTGAAAQFLEPTGLALVGGVLYVADRGDHTIRSVDIATGKVSTLIGLTGQEGVVDGDAAQAKLAGPQQLVADGLGDLYVGESTQGGGSTIRRIDIAAKRITAFAGQRYQQGTVSGPLPTTLGCPSSFAVAANGDLLIADRCDGVIAQIGAVAP